MVLVINKTLDDGQQQKHNNHTKKVEETSNFEEQNHSKKGFEKQNLLQQKQQLKQLSVITTKTDAPLQICDICKIKGVRKVIEMLPGNGVLYRTYHEDGNTCEWGDYSSIDDIKNAKGDAPEVDITCPSCGKMGKIGSKVDDPVHKPDTYTYQIHHLLDDDDIIIHDVKPEHRDVVLKALGRIHQS
jgi:hypothetical protein